MVNIAHAPRLYVEATLDPHTPFTIDDDRVHYLKNVMRLRESDHLRLFNGRDGEWQGRLKAFGKRSVAIDLIGQIRPQSLEPDLWLCCAPIKKAHFDYMIEKATELGVAVIQPILTHRTQIRMVNVDRCRVIAIEAAEQSERMTIPEIKKPVELAELAETWPQDRTLIVCAEAGEAEPLPDVLKAPALRPAKVAIVTGPEGGFAPEEFEALRKVPNAAFARLGPRILRADTAALAALSCWQALCGDWRSS